MIKTSVFERISLDSRYEITPYFSEKIKVLSLFAIIIVFYQHSGIIDNSYKTFLPPVIAYYSTAGFWGNCAVPLFYAISGFLFFYRAKELTIVFDKIKKRVRTLVVPFVIAAMYYPLVFILFEMSPLAEYIDRGSYLDFCKNSSCLDILRMLFWGSSDGYPWAYHLWFMRDLIIIVALSPLIYFFRKYTGLFSMAIPVVFLFIFPHLRFLEGLIWFVYGSIFLDKLDKLPRMGIFIISLLYILVVFYRIFTGDSPSIVMRMVEIGLGLTSIWGLFNVIVPQTFSLCSHRFLFWGSQFTFFLYLYHEPVFQFFVKFIVLVLGKNAIGFSIAIILPPIVFIPIGILFGRYIKKRYPIFYGMLVGGR